MSTLPATFVPMEAAVSAVRPVDTLAIPLGPGAPGGDRKTLDVHMHLMEAFTTLYEASGKELHRRKLKESIDI